MFKFDFAIQDAENEVPTEELIDVHGPRETPESLSPPFVASTIGELVKDLPSLISYSPLHVDFTGNRALSLLRRDLFDARFQLISEDKASKDLDFIDAPSDLVPGVYEGGLKTWECSADLAGYLDGVEILDACRPYKIIEVGCGTAIPSLSLLRKVFSDPEDGAIYRASPRMFHFQDYNFTVLQLMTVPNIILTWYASPASASYRASQSLPTASNSEPGELAITPELISSFLESLRDRHIELQFFSGAWIDLETKIHETQITYNLVITSETIYQSASLSSLISLLKAACTTQSGAGMSTTPSHELAQLSIDDSVRESASRRCLVAAKVIYFGVGGGMDEFERVLNEAGGQLSMVFEKKTGVGRRIMSLDWGHPA